MSYSGPSSSLSPRRIDKPLSRPSSRTSTRSNRAPSPQSFSSVPLLEDPVAVRNQISTLKHSIRHQQAQVHDLENVILRGPRPYSDISSEFMMPATTVGSPPSSYNHIQNAASSSSSRMSKRSSYDHLAHLAGSDSNLPLPRRDLGNSDEIREGIPVGTPKRNTSPTRGGLSRIPVAAVGNAKALADDGQPPANRKHSPIEIDTSSASFSSSSSLQPPSPSPSSRRLSSLTPTGTTKVLADLQTGVINARNALENTKAQLRLSQRSVAQLTRQTEDLKEGRERLRLENEGLNNVVARKERLLQETLERARKAESESAAYKSQLKSETTSSKKALREMEMTLAESTALSQRSEREYITLRDSIKGLVEGWKHDTDRLRDEMKKREERWKSEAEGIGKKYRMLVEEIQSTREGREALEKLKEEDDKIGKQVEESWTEKVNKMKQEIEKNSGDGEEALKVAHQVAGELARLRRLMQNAGRPTSPSIPP